MNRGNNIDSSPLLAFRFVSFRFVSFRSLLAKPDLEQRARERAKLFSIQLDLAHGLNLICEQNSISLLARRQSDLELGL